MVRSRSTSSHLSNRSVFVHLGDPETSHQDSANEFYIGRLAENNISICLPARNVSKLQARIVFKDKAWYLIDGSAEKSSTNGTWISLSSKRHRFERRPSQPVAIGDKDQLKISDYLIWFHFHNIPQQ